MNLKQLKLSGFKSFVDPTVVHFPSQLVAVVGPNGCGKSNIIDAVRWVMGESSAKNLRGESMTDVIFNGSANRKAVGQASVELIFDNQLGRLVGPFASYGEISVKRIVTRDGDSSYYLNGSRCRRRDITDIFLGTGAGARSYSIIGQGTISKLIEAKPEELRAYLEEAAGVSKYKERRRETLQRIAHTQENLTRVADIREELDKQLQRLERQAKAAERYAVLKDEEALCRATILALRWRDFHAQQEKKQHALYENALQHEQQQSMFTHVSTQRTLLQEQLHDANEAVQERQALFYQVSAEVTRLEDGIQQQQREQKRLAQDRQQMQEDWQCAAEQLKQDKEQVLHHQEQMHRFQEQVNQLQEELAVQDQLSQEQKERYSLSELHWQELHQKRTGIQSDVQVATLKLGHHQDSHQRLTLRLEKLRADQQSVSLASLEQTHAELEEQQQILIAQHHSASEQLDHGMQHSIALRTTLQEIETRLHQTQNDFHRVNSEYAALNAMQKAARHNQIETKESHLVFQERAQLIDMIHVDSQWQFVCEYLLGDALHAVVLDDLAQFWPHADACYRLRQPVLTLSETVSIGDRPKLIDKIKGPWPRVAPHLNFIYAAKNLDEAMHWLPDLLEHESIVTEQGFWIGTGWVKLLQQPECDELGLLARQQKISELTVLVSDLAQHTEQQQEARDRVYAQLQEALQANDVLQTDLRYHADALQAGSAALNRSAHEVQHAQQLLGAAREQEEEIIQTLEEVREESLVLEQQVADLSSVLQELDQQYELVHEEKQQQGLALNSLQQGIERTRRLLHQAELDYDRAMNKTQQLNESIAREQERLDVLTARLEQLALLCVQASNPEEELQQALVIQLQKHQHIETQLTQQREEVTRLKITLDDVDKELLMHDAALKKTQDQMAQLRMEEQELSVRASAVEESLQETGLELHTLLEHTPKECTQSQQEAELLALLDKIKRLGAINLAAVEEFTTEQQRKIYLDDQYDDLSQALNALHTAIEKMDNETRVRLEQTFNDVNQSFMTLFPRLFGGGRAQLELTCDNLLEAGIVVMAQPPGKRNSTIHLLSGGEKAMTAVALVFAIFQLNPSPFCMLDEVDAPLDDVNVGRFCSMVKEMSQFVQFLFITHNKIAMELADHLIGVTMREPGVSRLVTVDVLLMASE